MATSGPRAPRGGERGRARGRSPILLSLGIAVPICLLVAAVVADRILHHKPPPRLAPPHLPAPAQPLRPVDAVAPASQIDYLLARFHHACPDPDAVASCSPRALTISLERDLPAIQANRSELEQRFLDALPTGFEINIHGLGFLRSRRALPALRPWLLGEGYFEERATPENPEIYFADENFPRHRALIQAIESIEGHAIKLTRAERRRLSREAAGCNWPAPSQWLLHKLEGTPLPTVAESRARDLACARVPLPPDRRSTKPSVIPM